ncbi:MAG: MFS transporter [Tolypothrix carrinoi HA7290-LM1]|jgi:DHA2 family methylenomycin A resistance protein-like MFS transporter|nr:MFS transporter [Tolypothrix carrinoi HA7290-LM1]
MLALTAICIGFFMVLLDNSVVNVALKRIQENLDADVSGLQWVIDGYALVFACLQLTAGTLGDRLGSKRVFLAGLLVFTVASVLCGLAVSLWDLLAARALQGVGAALLVPASLSLISHIFLESEERAKAMGAWSTAGGIALAAGPVLGGLLIDTLGWRSIFFINLPVGVVAYIFTVRFVSASPCSKHREFDLAGQVTWVAALCSLTFVLIEGSAQGWGSVLIIEVLGIFAVAAAAFIVLERRAKSPMLPLGLFAIPTFSAATLAALLQNFAYYGVIFLLSLFLQQVRGYSPLVTGLAFLPMTGTVAFASTLAGHLTGRFGPRLPMVAGLALCSVGFITLTTINATTSYVVIFIILLPIGFGAGLIVPPLATALIGAAPKERSGVASGILNTSRQVGGLLGVALLGSLVKMHHSFVDGMHLAFITAGGAQLVSCVITLRYLQSGKTLTEVIRSFAKARHRN